MLMSYRINKLKLSIVLVLFVISTILGSIILMMNPTKAAGFSMQTGYYVGTGVAGRVISGVGFQPDLIIIKGRSGGSAVVASTVFRSTGMAAANTGYFTATADSTTTAITPNSDGFVLGSLAAVNAQNYIYTWTAFTGSDCTSAGNFCVGTYTGNGGGVKSLTTGFQPSMVIVKRSNSIAAHFRTASMPSNQNDFFTTGANDSTGNYIGSFSSTGFSVGATDNTNTGVYYFIAFKATASSFAEGSYTGDATDNRDISGLGFKPNLVMVKNDTSATVTNRNVIMSSTENNGDASNYVGGTTTTFFDIPDNIQKLSTNSFQVGTSASVNESGATMYWFAFGGAPLASGASGTYKMEVGSYTGTGAVTSISSLSFKPDLVIIKDTSTGFMVFRTALMAGDITAYLANPSADSTNHITSLDANGFSLGTNTNINATGRIYHWQAFGNAYKPDTKSGAADFALGSYPPSGVDDTDIIGPPYQMDFITIKNTNNTTGAFHTSEQGNSSGFLSNTAETTDAVKLFNSNGFRLGTNTSVNSGTSIFRWFGFKASPNFAVGSYIGTGVANRAVTLGSGIQPNLVWVKQSGTAAPISRPSSLTGDATQFFSNVANTTGAIKSFTATGITIGTGTTNNSSGATYRYIAWKAPVGVLSGDIVNATGAPVTAPSFNMNNAGYPFGCDEVSGTLGQSDQRLRVSNMTTSPSWSMSIAATNGPAAVWSTSGNTQQYDYNDSAGDPAGCSDGNDSDSIAGKLRVEPSTAVITPQSGGCTTANISLGSNQDFNESTTDAITLMAASSSANTGCYWDLTGINLRQYIPLGQASGSYSLDLTITTMAQ
jgi:hypothetical protein